MKLKRRHIQSITARFALVFMVIVPTLLVTAFAGVYGLRQDRDSIQSLYRNHLQATAAAANLSSLINGAHQEALELLLTTTSSGFRDAHSDLDLVVAAKVNLALERVNNQSFNSAPETHAAKSAAAEWARFQDFLSMLPPPPQSPTTRNNEALQVDSLLNHATTSSNIVERAELQQSAAEYSSAIARYHDNLWLIALVVIAGLLLAVGVVIWLVRSVLPRTLAYSAFAARITEGDLTTRLQPYGNDELAELGRTLDRLAERRQDEEAYDARKIELTESLQVTSGESEAHDLLKRYIEQTIERSTATVLSRNNSADRLLPVTALSDTGPLIAALDGASPRSCLAIRLARTSARTPEVTALVPCSICSSCESATLCAPLLVSGEVIGSVLTEFGEPVDDHAERSIRDAVSLAAPVLGNLRNLAIAELRAATDALTGLPNRRALHDHVRRLVANASRSFSPLSALMCDLDHFKRINDQFGHGSGDEVLAAVGVLLPGVLRTSDFAGRYGGEEFLVLLPDTDSDGAQQIADKIRDAVGHIRVPAIERRITMSIGVATFPTHANDADSLERAADRALYTAKAAGRDRVELVDASVTSAATEAPDTWPESFVFDR